MNDQKTIAWVLRIGVAGEFLGHSMFALQQKQAWIGWLQKLIGIDSTAAGQLLFLIGILDLVIAFVVLVKPIRLALLWAAFWGFLTALVRPIVGESFWDFIERFANWAAPLALLLLSGWPKSIKEWFKTGN